MFTEITIKNGSSDISTAEYLSHESGLSEEQAASRMADWAVEVKEDDSPGECIMHFGSMEAARENALEFAQFQLMLAQIGQVSGHGPKTSTDEVKLWVPTEDLSGHLANAPHVFGPALPQ